MHLVYPIVSLLLIPLFVGIMEGNAAPCAYITNSNSGTVSVIDTGSNMVIDTVGVGSQAFGVAVSPNGTRVYTTNGLNDNNVSVIDTATNTEITTIPVGSDPEGIAITPNGTRLYVANSQSNTVSVINTSTNAVVATIVVGDDPTAVAATSDGTKVYVTNKGPGTDRSISVILTSTNTVDTMIIVSGDNDGASGLAINPVSSRLYATMGPSDRVLVIDTVTDAVVDEVAVGDNPSGAAVNPNGSRLYVTNQISDTVSVIDTSNNSVITTISVGDFPYGLAIKPDGARLYVVNHLDHNVSVIDTASNMVIDTIPVGERPTAFGLFIGGPGNCTLALDVTVDIKPGSYPNCININGNGVIPVAVLGSAEFDVNDINRSTLSFAGLNVRVRGNGNPQCSVDDVSGDFTSPEGAPDGHDDLVCQFIDDTDNWEGGNDFATITGSLNDSTPFEGSDSICVVPSLR